MNVRGERECQDCGTRWSYYETGSIECPNCDSLRSVGIDDRTTHTDAAATLNLDAHRARFGDAPGFLPEEGVDELKSTLRDYLRKRGFIRGGELRPLDTTYLAARELLEAVDCYDRLRNPTDRDREYLLDLLGGVDSGDRLEAARVPDSLREARGLAAVRAVDEYRSDLLTFLDELESHGAKAEDDEPKDSRDEPKDPHDKTGDTADSGTPTPTVWVTGANGAARVADARNILGRLRDQTKRIEALTGDVPPADADALTDAANATGEYVRTGNESALSRARERLSSAAE